MGTRGKWQWTDGQLSLPPLTEGQPRPHMQEGTSDLILRVRLPILMEWCELVGLKTAHGRCLVMLWCLCQSMLLDSSTTPQP